MSRFKKFRLIPPTVYVIPVGDDTADEIASRIRSKGHTIHKRLGESTVYNWYDVSDNSILRATTGQVVVLSEEFEYPMVMDEIEFLSKYEIDPEEVFRD